MVDMPNRKPIRVGVLGTGGIVRLAVPQMLQATGAEIAAIASRSAEKAAQAAQDLGIPQSFGSYEALLADPSIDAVYVALPIALHAEWTVKALRARKHVLCEKPLTTSTADTKRVLAEAAEADRIVWEGFMVRHHPQWQAVEDILAAGRIGKVRAVQGMLTRTPPNAFDPVAIANRAELGGGVLLDGGCYLVHFARLAFGTEPSRVTAVAEDDADLGVTTFLSAMMEFGTGTASFTVSSRLRRFQRVLIVGTEGSLDIRIPVMPPPAHPAIVIADYADTPLTADPDMLEFGPVPSFREEIEAFADAIRGRAAAPFVPGDALHNAAVIEALAQSAAWRGVWTEVVPQDVAHVTKSQYAESDHP
jgi:predicted dehydrogenase